MIMKKTMRITFHKKRGEEDDEFEEHIEQEEIDKLFANEDKPIEPEGKSDDDIKVVEGHGGTRQQECHRCER